MRPIPSRVASDPPFPRVGPRAWRRARAFNPAWRPRQRTGAGAPQPRFSATSAVHRSLPDERLASVSVSRVGCASGRPVRNPNAQAGRADGPSESSRHRPQSVHSVGPLIGPSRCPGEPGRLQWSSVWHLAVEPRTARKPLNSGISKVVRRGSSTAAAKADVVSQYGLIHLALEVGGRCGHISHGQRQNQQRITKPIWWYRHSGAHSAEPLRLGKQTLCQLSYSRSASHSARPSA